jgi:hypothetical protein
LSAWRRWWRLDWCTDSKVIDEGENNVPCGVSRERVGNWGVAELGEVLGETVVRNLSGLFESRHAFGISDVDSSHRKLQLVRYCSMISSGMISSGGACTRSVPCTVEILRSAHEVSVRCGNGAVEEALGGGHTQWVVVLSG